MAVCDMSILGSGSGCCSAVGNSTKDLRKTRSWKDPKNAGLLEAGAGPALDSWETLFTSEPFSGGLELFLEAKRIQVGQCGKLLCGPEL